MNTRPYSDELTHYGVKGMKWGVRRDKKRIERKLNRLDQDFANETAKSMRSRVSAERYLKKGNRAKAVEAGKKSVASNKNARNIESEQWKLIGEAARKNYSVSAQQIRRSGERGREFVVAILGGAVGGSVLGSMRVSELKNYPGDEQPWNIQGQRFRVY